MKLCPTCQRCYEDADAICLQDRTPLVASRPGPRLLAGKYRLDQLLGSGDKGTAYMATDVELDSPVIAVDLLRISIITDPQELERFYREARAAAHTSGQEVADIYDYGFLPNGGAYVVMELVERGTPPKATPPAPSLANRSAVDDLRLPQERGISSSGEDFDESETITKEDTQEEQDTQDEPRPVLRPSSAADSRHIVEDDAETVVSEGGTQLAHGPALPPKASGPSRQAGAGKSAPSPAPIVVGIPAKGRARRSPLVYAGLVVALALGIAAVWLALRRAPERAANPPAAPISSPTTNPPATELIPPADPAPASHVGSNPPPVEETGSRATYARSRAQVQTPSAVLRARLDEWIAATVARDIEWQMTFYMPTLTVFYLKRNVTQDFVREEKMRLLAEAETIEVRLVNEPRITFSEGGRVATMRFRKSYVMEGAGRSRRGEVVQELRWRKTDEGWKIFSERDL